MNKETSKKLKLLYDLKKNLLYEKKIIQDLGVFVTMSESIYINNAEKVSGFIGILPALCLLELIITGLQLKISERNYEYTLRDYNSEKRILEKRQNHEY